MNTTGREYALALFETAYESGNIDDIRNNIRSLKRLFKEMPEYIEFLSEITSAVELTDEEKAKIVAKLEKITGKTVRPRYKINPALMGGITVTANGMFFDGSVRKNLKNLEKEIS